MTAEDPRRILFAEFTALPGKGDEVERLVSGLSERVRREPGNLVFQATRRRDAPNRFFVYEEYRDSEAFREHIEAEYGAEFNAALADLIVEDRSQLTWLAPV